MLNLCQNIANIVSEVWLVDLVGSIPQKALSLFALQFDSVVDKHNKYPVNLVFSGHENCELWCVISNRIFLAFFINEPATLDELGNRDIKW